MKYIKQFEIFRGASITSQLSKTIKNASTLGNPLLNSIINNEYSDFNKNLRNINDLKTNLLDMELELKKLKEENLDEERIKQTELFIEHLKNIYNRFSLETTDYYGNTPLLIAAKEGRLKMLKELIKAGANIYHTNNNGETMYDLAVNRYKFINNVKDWIEKNYPEVIAMKKFNL